MQTSQASEIYLTAKQKSKEKKYWLNQLSGELTRSAFPYDYKNTGKNKAEMKTISCKFPDELTQCCMKLSNNSDLRLYILLAVSVSLLLGKYTGHRDIILGTSIYRQNTEDDLINTVLALRNHWHDGMTVKEFILQMSKTIFDAAEHQNYPIKVLLNQLGFSDWQDEFPLFDTAILLENLHNREYIRHIPLNIIFSFLRLEGENRIEGTVEYNGERYHETGVRRMIDHLIHLMNTAFFDIHLPLGDIQLLSKTEKNFLLHNLEGKVAQYPVNKTIPQLFEQQVIKNPDALAVSGPGGVSLNYRQLNEKANQLARQLRKRGVKDDSIVGIMTARTADMVVGMMAVMKAGGTYLPVAAGNPRARQEFIFRDSSINVLLTQEKLYEKNKNLLQQFTNLDIFLLDIETTYIGEKSNLEITHKANQLAYVIYTSGTTGRPKAVMIEHPALINFIYSMYNSYDRDFGSRDKSLHLTTISFDVSVCELFLPLVFGAAIVVVPEEKLFDPAELAKTIIEEAITFAYIPPALLKEVCTHLGQDRTRVALNKLLVGVEPINDYVLEEYRQLNQTMKIVNGYGPTETTICATSYDFNLHSPGGINVPIGKPLDNMKVVLLDQQQDLYPLGVPGELCISGAGLARGYLNRVQLTAEKFVDNPYFPGERMYKTGDLARWRKDGNIEFQGRIDNQIKIRGYRIEPGEIENRLLAHKSIKDAVVIDVKSTRENEMENNSYLCAYVVFQSTALDVGNPPTNSQLVDFLSLDLPAFMIPQYFLPLKQIPLTPNGKLDRKALPDPGQNNEIKVEYIAPTNENEQIIADIWKEILHLDRIGINDNFFQIGGNSLSIVKLRNQLREEFERDIPDVKLLEFPTISSFNEYLHLELSPPAEDEKDEETEPYEVLEPRINKIRMRKNRVLEEDE